VPSPESETIIVRVSDKVLYVGSGTACPLAGIVRVRCERLWIDQGRYVRIILGNLVISLIIWFVADGFGNGFARIGSVAGSSGGATSAAFGWIEFAALLFFVIKSLEPVRMLLLSRYPYHALTIDTAGYASSRLVNEDGDALGKIAKMIIDAIDDPAATWQVPVVNYHIGDTINQAGPASIGKVMA
jgi:hypothetical protein